MLRDVSWRSRANCRHLGPENGQRIFFGQMNPQRKELCDGCCVKPQCLAFVLASEDQLRVRDGWYAGMSAVERDKKFGTIAGGL